MIFNIYKLTWNKLTTNNRRLWLASLFTLGLFGCQQAPEEADMLSRASEEKTQLNDAINSPTASQDLMDAQATALANASASPSPDTANAGVIAPTSTDKTFEMTPDDFKERFMVAAESAGLDDGELDAFNIVQGEENDSFVQPLSDAVAMMGTVDKNGELKSIIYMMGKTDNTNNKPMSNELMNNELMNMVLMASLTARTLNPTVSKEQIGSHIVDLLNQSLQDFETTGQGSNNDIINNIRYFSVVNPETGIWLGFEPA